MSRHEDPHGYDENLQAETVSPHRPPQFNASTCGYRCGWGCCEPVGGDDDGGGHESDATPTLIGSDDGEEFERTEQDDADALSSVASDLQGEIEDQPVPIVVNDFEDDANLNLPILVQAPIFSSEQSEWDYQGSTDSLDNQAASEPQSSAASDRRSIGSVSPCGWDAGIGAWDDMDKTGHMPELFCVTPLRLSPQYEHCRGKAASHLVVQDYSMLLESGVDDYRRRILSYVWTLFPSEVTHEPAQAD